MFEYIQKIEQIPSEKMDNQSKIMIISAIKAISNLEGWNELSNFTPRKDCEFIWEDDPLVNRATSEVSRPYYGYSSCSMVG